MVVTLFKSDSSDVSTFHIVCKLNVTNDIRIKRRYIDAYIWKSQIPYPDYARAVEGATW